MRITYEYAGKKLESQNILSISVAEEDIELLVTLVSKVIVGYKFIKCKLLTNSINTLLFSSNKLTLKSPPTTKGKLVNDFMYSIKAVISFGLVLGGQYMQQTVMLTDVNSSSKKSILVLIGLESKDDFTIT